MWKKSFKRYLLGSHPNGVEVNSLRANLMARLDLNLQSAVGRSLESATSEDQMFHVIVEHLLIKHPLHTRRMEVISNSPGSDHTPSLFIEQQIVSAELTKLGEASMEALVLHKYITVT